MSFTRVQSKELQGVSLASGSTISFTSSVTVGSLLALLAAQGGVANRQISAVSDNVNGAWTLAKRQGTAGTNAQAEVWYFPNSAGGVITVTITWANGNDSKDFLAIEYSGCDTTTPLDVTDGITGTSNTNQQYATSSDTTSSNGSVILGVSALNGGNTGYSSTSSFTQITSANVNVTFAERIATGAVTTNGSYTITSPRNFNAAMVSFKAPTGASPVSNSVTIPVEILQGIAASATSPAEWLQGIADAITIPVELLQGLSGSATIPAEWLQGILSGATITAEYLGSLTRGVTIPTEILGGIAGAGPLSVEWLTAIQSNQSLAAEWLAAASVGVAVPVEWLAGVSVAANLAAEWLIAIQAAGLLPVEILGHGPSPDAIWVLDARGSVFVLDNRGNVWALSPLPSIAVLDQG